MRGLNFEFDRIHCMDCLGGMRLPEDGSVNVNVTSPPTTSAFVTNIVARTCPAASNNIGLAGDCLKQTFSWLSSFRLVSLHIDDEWWLGFKPLPPRYAPSSIKDFGMDRSSPV